MTEDQIDLAMVIDLERKQSDILEEEQAHRAQISVLSHLHLQQQELLEIHVKELRQSSALVEEQ